ncbi:hypothetical protein TNCV_3342911 [Trichonephila clavipes]|nr:hypothetical protein TNCV_3342911 [Trichonephila clavipes]
MENKILGIFVKHVKPVGTKSPHVGGMFLKITIEGLVRGLHLSRAPKYVGANDTEPYKSAPRYSDRETPELALSLQPSTPACGRTLNLDRFKVYRPPLHGGS